MVVRPFGKTQGPEQVEGQAQTSSEPQSNSHPVFDPEAQTRREPAEGENRSPPDLNSKARGSRAPGRFLAGELTGQYLGVTRKHVEKQNVTLSIPKDVLREAKHLAVDRGTSLSGLLVEALEERVKRLSEMRRAAERQRALMRRGLRLGTKGKARWTREDLHAR